MQYTPELTWSLGKIGPEGLTQRAPPSPARSARWVSITHEPLKTNNRVSRGAGWQWTAGPERPERWFMEADCCQERNSIAKLTLENQEKTDDADLGEKPTMLLPFLCFMSSIISFSTVFLILVVILFPYLNTFQKTFSPFFLSPSHSFKL